MQETPKGQNHRIAMAISAFSKSIRVVKILILLIVTCPALAQENNVWVLNGFSTIIKLDFNFNPPMIVHFDTAKLSGNLMSKEENYYTSNQTFICNEKGELSYFSLIDGSVYDASLNYITNMNERRTAFTHQHLALSSDTFKMLRLSSESLSNMGNDSILIIEDSSRGFAQKYVADFFELSVDSSLSNTEKRIITIPFNDRLWILYVRNNVLQCNLLNLETCKIERRNEGLKNLVWYPHGFASIYDYTEVGDLLATIHSKNYTTDSNAAGQNSVSIAHFDKVAGNLTNQKIIFTDSSYFTKGGRLICNTRVNDICFSPSGKYLYLSVAKANPEYHTYWELIRINIITGDIEYQSFNDAFIFSKLKLGPDNKIYIIPKDYSRVPSRFSQQYIGIIKKPEDMNWKASISLNEPYLNLFESTLVSKIQISTLPNTLGHYVPIGFTDTNACVGLYTAFTNQSDSTHFTRYRFYFGDGDSAEIDNDNNLLVAGIDNKVNPNNWGVHHRYTKSGKYLVKLRAFNEAGGWVWYSDSITVVEASIPKFSIQDRLGCQWVGYEIQDLSKVVNKGKDVTYHWSFGDGTDSTYSFPLGEGWEGDKKLFKTYTQSGDYAIQLTINDGYCTDSFSLLNKVKILEAPQPGIVANPKEGCEPLAVNVNYKYSDAADSIVYYWGNGKSTTTKDGEAQYTYQLYPGFTTTQYYNLEQELHGPTGCITRDTIQITVHPGFYSTDTPRLNLASVNADQYIALSWDSFPGATAYAVYRNQNALAQTSQFSWIDSVTKAQLQTAMQYTIKAVNVCDEKTAESNIGQNIVLTGTSEKNNRISVVQWTPYEKWQLGVSDYAIEVQQSDGSFAEVYRQQASGNLVYQDEAFLATALSQNQTSKCYRIAAYEKDYPQQISHSNILCLPYTPVLFIPTAITPNADGLNDVFKPITFGIASYNVQIYNRWGQLVADFDETSPGWEAKEMPQGAYMVTIRAKGNDNNWYTENSTVTVVR